MEFKNINQEEIWGFATDPVKDLNDWYIMWPDARVWDPARRDWKTSIQFEGRPEEDQNPARTRSFRYVLLGPNAPMWPFEWLISDSYARLHMEQFRMTMRHRAYDDC